MRSRIFYQVLARVILQRTTFKRKISARFPITLTESRTALSRSTKWFRPSTNNTNRSRKRYSIKTNAFSRGSRRNKRRPQAKMERNQLKIPEYYTHSPHRYHWPQTQKRRLRKAAKRNWSRYKETQQSLYLRRMILLIYLNKAITRSFRDLNVWDFVSQNQGEIGSNRVSS